MRTKSAGLAVPALLAMANTAAQGGEVYGKITSGGAAVGEAAQVAARCGQKTYPAVKTDKGGGYHLVLQESGKCTLSVTFKGASASVDVVSYDEAAQADIALETKDGKLTARRR